MCLLDDLFARLGKPVPTNPEEKALAESAIYDALAIVSTYGKAEWYADPGRLPVGVKAVVLAVAERRVRNPKGFVSETAGEYSYRRPEQAALGLGLTAGEIALIEKATGVRGLVTVETVRSVRLNHSVNYPWPDGKDRWDA
ncbi:hypothetical protein [Streptomyces sp. NPDC127112]|uniref:hypothetical protein n=1 Tax=Streptomyces sp. NPDC127112 TaxID=3345364 RepID=UPI0036292D77